MKSSEAKHIEQLTCVAFQNNPMMETIYDTTGKELAVFIEKDLFGGMFSEVPLETFVAELDGRVIGYIRSGSCNGDWHSGNPCTEEEYKHIVNQKVEDLSIAQRWDWLNMANEEHDLTSPHSHMGPIAVLPEFQGKGIGTLLMEDYFTRLDGVVSFLETFQMPNVRFYEKNGYSVVATEFIFGVKGYWMKRD
jgi:ribosomal protein S18 acetylase RimI-like enzyme